MRFVAVASALLLWCSAAHAQIAVGTYAGDGAADHSITGVGFSPALVVTIPDSPYSARVRWASFPAALSIGLAATDVFDGGIDALLPDGFRLGDAVQVNEQGIVNHYLALGPGAVATGTYQGNGMPGMAISRVGFPPAWVWVKTPNMNVVHRSAAFAGATQFFGPWSNDAGVASSTGAASASTPRPR